MSLTDALLPLLLIFLSLSCEKSPQLEPNTISKLERIKQNKSNSSFFLKNKRQKEFIGFMLSYLPKYDYYLLIVISEEPLHEIYVDGKTKIKLTKKPNWFDEPLAIISESLMKEIALSSTISTDQTKFETSEELYLGIKLLLSEVNILEKERTDYNMDW